MRAPSENATRNFLLGQWQDFKVPFVFAANGRPYVQQLQIKSGIWFADLRQSGNMPRAMAGWPSPLGLKEMLQENTAEGNAAYNQEIFL